MTVESADESPKPSKWATLAGVGLLVGGGLPGSKVGTPVEHNLSLTVLRSLAALAPLETAEQGAQGGSPKPLLLAENPSRVGTNELGFRSTACHLAAKMGWGSHR